MFDQVHLVEVLRSLTVTEDGGVCTADMADSTPKVPPLLDMFLPQFSALQVFYQQYKISINIFQCLCQ